MSTAGGARHHSTNSTPLLQTENQSGNGPMGTYGSPRVRARGRPHFSMGPKNRTRCLELLLHKIQRPELLIDKIIVLCALCVRVCVLCVRCVCCVRVCACASPPRQVHASHGRFTAEDACPPRVGLVLSARPWPPAMTQPPLMIRAPSLCVLFFSCGRPGR